MAYVGLVRDGTVLPVFIVSRNKRLLVEVDRDGHKVVHIEGVKEEGSATIIAYLD